jgi:hypothetical protein
MSEKEVTIRLTFAEAVVLDEFLRRYSNTDILAIEDQGERSALWNLACLLERDGDRPNWPSLEEARAELRISDD